MIPVAFTLFLAGILTILLPCILPLVPVVLGVSIADNRKLRPLVTILGMLVSFVGFTFLLQVLLSQFYEVADYIRLATYQILFLFGVAFLFQRRLIVILGALTSGLFFWEKGIVSVSIAAILGVLAMEIGGRIAGHLQQLGADVQQSARGTFGNTSLLTSFVVGLTLGLVWVPCAGPALGFAFSLVREEPGLKALVLLTIYGIGTGIPLLLVGYGGQAAVHSVRALTAYTGRIKQGAGFLLLISAIAFYFNWFLALQTWLVQNTRYGIFGTELEERLVGDSLTEDVNMFSVPETSGERLPVLGTAPTQFQGLGPWHNSEPLNLSELRGKVVLVDFWTYSCINCIRTLPYIRGYWDKYRSQPFVLIGVHTPEFAFEKVEANVADAIKRYELTYPIAQDNNYETWRAFENRYWPAKYLIDAQGRIRYVHFGEGAYEETDAAIASLLAEIGAKSDGASISAAPSPGGRDRTHEIYFSTRSWEDLANSVDPEEAAKGHEYFWDTKLAPDNYALLGKWRLVDDERQVLESETGTIFLRMLGSEANLVLGLEGGAKPVKVDVTVDRKKTSTITVDRHDLYPLFKGEYGEHEIILTLQGSGVGAYAFTFGG